MSWLASIIVTLISVGLVWLVVTYVPPQIGAVLVLFCLLSVFYDAVAYVSRAVAARFITRNQRSNP